MPYQSNLAALTARINAARDAGLVAAAEVVKTEVKLGLRGGYTSGDFVTGASLSSVTRSEPVTEDGVRVIRVGTSLMYNLYWELGFVPARGVFSPGIGPSTQGPIGIQRKEIWMPALTNTAAQQALAYARAFAQALAESPAPA